MVVWGAQECLMSEKEMQVAQLARHLGSNYHKVACVDMWELFLVCFIHKKHAQFLKRVQTSYKATGVGGYVGNKGGLCISFTLYEKHFLFVNLHLKSGAFKASERTAMFTKVMRSIMADKLEPDAQADFCTVLGDLNYRFNSTFSEHIAHIKKSALLTSSLDELCIERVQGRFPGYYEMPIEFEPTYKREFKSNRSRDS